MCISLFGISIKELLNGIGSSNYVDRENLLEEINNTPTKIIKASNDRLGDIENAPAKIEGDKEEYVTFGELPDGMILDVNTDQGKGVECLIGKYRRYYSKIRKQSLIDLYLSKEDGAERLKEDINEFCQQFKSYDNIENFINGVKEENEKRSAKRTMRQIFGALVLGVVLLIGLSSILSTLIGDPADETSQILSACCGGFDLIVGIVFFILERIEDSNEKEREEKISNAQSKLFKAVKDAKIAAEDSKIAAEEAKTAAEDSKTTAMLNIESIQISGKLGDTLNSTFSEMHGTFKEIKKERENLGICEQCHVPLENDCNVCGHKNYPGTTGAVNKDYIDCGLNPNKAEQDCKSYNWTLKKNGECNYTVIFNNNNIILSAEACNICNNSYPERLAAPKYVKKIVFNAHVKNVKLKEDEKANCKNIKAYYENIQDIFPEVEIVAFAQPERCNGEIIKQYELGENIFNGLYGKVNVKGLEYIAKAEKGCFGGWNPKYCMGLDCEGKECFQTSKD